MISDKVQALDLEPIMVKLMDSDEGLGWSLEFTKKVEIEYKKYLTLCLENPDFPVVPSTFVDDFWHFHILDTLKYEDDCKNVFGYFLHHFPYFGMRGEEDKENLQKTWKESIALYEKRFGAVNKDLWSVSKRCPNCGRRCNSGLPYMLERPRLAA